MNKEVLGAVEFKIAQFEKFYNSLMSNPPEGYTPWFFPCDKQNKNPAPVAIIKIDPLSKGSWHHKSARLNKQQCIEHIKQGWNLGISAREKDALIIGDVDNPKLLDQLPKNTLTCTSRKREAGHFFGWDKDGSAKINIPTDDGELRSNNQYVLCPGSYVPFNLKDKKEWKAYTELSPKSQQDPLRGYYTVRDELPPREFGFDDLPEFFKKVEVENIEADAKIQFNSEKKEYGGKYDALFKLKVSDIVGKYPSTKRKGHPLHDSDTDANFSLSKDGTLAHCWRHIVSLNAVQYLCVKVGYAKCQDAGKPHKSVRSSKLKGDKKAYEVAYKEAVRLELIKPATANPHTEEGKETEKIEVKLPKSGRLISEFIEDIIDILSEKKILFYRSDVKYIVEIGKIKHNENENKAFTGFIQMKPSRFITLVERFFIPGHNILKKDGDDLSIEFKSKSMTKDLSNTILDSQILEDNLPNIHKIFTIPIPIIYKEKLTFPNVGYDGRFNSWLPHNSPKINTKMNLKEAKVIIENILKEFCFQTKEDKNMAVAGLITPFLRGLYHNPNCRTPIFIYLGNRERIGKDYLAGVNGIIYEGVALEEPPLSVSGKGNADEELRKKILAAFLSGRKRLHFSNNKGFINNAVFEGIATATTYSDRLLGKNELLVFDNELEFSLSGNIGIGFTPDLAGRSRVINLFFDKEDTNKRKFENPILHKWVLDNRNLILSAIYVLVKNWVDQDSPDGKIPFTSFPEWARVCGGIMECAGYDSPCNPSKEDLAIGGDNETMDMKLLFELCYEKRPDTPLTKAEMRDLIRDEEIFNYLDFDKNADKIKFGNKIIKFKGRVLSDIRMSVTDNSIREARRRYIFKKEVSTYERGGSLGSLGSLSTLEKHKHIKNKSNRVNPLPTIPTLPKKQEDTPNLDTLDTLNKKGSENLPTKPVIEDFRVKPEPAELEGKIGDFSPDDVDFSKAGIKEGLKNE